MTADPGMSLCLAVRWAVVVVVVEVERGVEAWKV